LTDWKKPVMTKFRELVLATSLDFVEDFENRTAENVFEKLHQANLKENHKTSKNYLYVIRMLIYYAGGGRDPEKIKWSYWKG
jgi:hypothetical protein